MYTTISGSCSSVYSSPGGPTIIQDAFAKTQFDVDIYKLKAAQEIELIKLNNDIDIKRRELKWERNQREIREKFSDIEKWMKDIKELMYI